MGATFSTNEGVQNEVPDERYIVVPPLLEADYAREEVERFAMSGYDWCARMPALRLLLLKHMETGARSTVHVAPSQDMLLYASTNLENLTWENVVSRPAENQGRCTNVYLPRSTFKMRQAMSRYTFASLRYSQHKARSTLLPVSAYQIGPRYSVHCDQGGQETPWLSACFCGPGRRWAAYAHMPLHKNMRELAAHQAYGGFRIGSKVASLGAEATREGLQSIWFLSKFQLHEKGGRNLLMGAQFDVSSFGARYARPAAFGRLSDAVTQLSSRANVFAEYTLGPPTSSTTLHVAVDEGHLLKMAAFHHIARVRRVYNLFEDDDVVGVCNYLDFGIRVVAPLDSNGVDESNFEAAGSWQVNSNLMVKAAACAKRVTAALVLKSWWNPRFTGSVMAGWDLQLGHPCLGCHVTIDNDDALMPQYQRGYHGTRTGSLVREMHVATRAEVAIAGGDRVIVPEDSDAAEKENYLFMPPGSSLNVGKSDVL